MRSLNWDPVLIIVAYRGIREKMFGFARRESEILRIINDNESENLAC